MQKILEVIKVSRSRLQFISKKIIKEVAYFLLLTEYFNILGIAEKVGYITLSERKLNCIVSDFSCSTTFSLGTFNIVFPLTASLVHLPCPRACVERGRGFFRVFISLLNHQITAQCIWCFSMCSWPCLPCSDEPLLQYSALLCGSWAIFK